MTSIKVPCETSTSSMDTSKKSYVNDSSAILTNLVNLVVDEETCDVKLVLGATVFPAHKVLLMASSSYFKKMFLGEWMESHHAAVTIHELPECQAVFPLFLSFLYCGHISLTIDSVLPVLLLADKYDVQPLVKLCTGYMAGVVEEGNLECALKFLPIADLFSLETIKKSCISLIAWNIESAAAVHQLWSLLPIDQLVSILESGILIVKDEYKLFNLVEKRLLTEGTADVTVSTVMKCLNFKHMAAEQLLQVEKSMIVNLAGIQTIKMEILEAFRHSALSSNNLQDHRDCEQNDNRWYEDELKHESKFTGGIAPIHITGSTGRGVQQLQRWILRCYKLEDKTGPHCVQPAEVVASKETIFASSQNRPDRYRLHAKFALSDSKGTVYWAMRVTKEDIVIPNKVDDPLVSLPFICGSTSSMFRCKCLIQPATVKYSIKLTKL